MTTNEMHREDFKILTQRNKGECHQETLVIVDWSGMTTEDYQAMAKSLFTWNFQCYHKRSSDKIPKEVNVLMRAEVHKTPATKKTMPRKPKAELEMDKADSKMDKLLAQLTPEEIATLLKDLS